MKTSKEINALIKLLDDPDQEVFKTVRNKILDYGKIIIPKLEQEWEKTEDELLQERIEQIIDTVNFNTIKDQLNSWLKTPNHDLKDGSFILSEFQYPGVDKTEFEHIFKRIYQSCWLEINEYLTPLEKVNILNSIIYSSYKFYGEETTQLLPSSFFLSEVIHTRKGNNFSLGVIYLLLCKKLDIPIYAIKLPQQFVLVYVDTIFDFFTPIDEEKKKILFYLEPNTGNIYTHNDVSNYLRKNQLKFDPASLQILTNVDIIKQTLIGLQLAYQLENKKEKEHQVKELLLLINQSLDLK
ncbi:MAG: transglutaminase family protein [Chitinophagaceae bacterium]|nr:transglutaminase family protein [Chitinophagaceae bacterium]